MAPEQDEAQTGLGETFLASFPHLRGDPYAVLRALDHYQTRAASEAERLYVEAARAAVHQRLLEPPDDVLLDALETSGEPVLIERAATLRRTQAAIDDDPVPALREAAATVEDGIERRWFRIRLALALDAADAPEAPEALQAAFIEQSPSDPLRAEVVAALQRRGLPTELPRTEAVNPRTGSAGTGERVERLQARLASDGPDEDLLAELALARFEHGDPDAVEALEEVYIGLSHRSPWREPLEAAFRELGLL